VAAIVADLRHRGWLGQLTCEAQPVESEAHVVARPEHKAHLGRGAHHQ
jgi:hypothetical protein